MGYDTSRRALRAALPPFLFGFLIWVLSAGLHVLAGLDLAQSLSERLALDRVAAVTGAVAAGLVLGGGALLARARCSNRRVGAAYAFFTLWLLELLLRLWTLAANLEQAFDLLAVRILLANLAMLSLSTAMFRIAGEGDPHQPLRTWLITRAAFVFQLLLGVALWYGLRYGLIQAGGPLRGPLRGFLDAVIWVVLIAPYVHAYLSLQRTVRRVAATETLAEILGG